MSIVTYNDQDFAFDTVNQSVDKELTGAILRTVDTDQNFFDIYLAAHAQRHRKRFAVR